MHVSDAYFVITMYVTVIETGITYHANVVITFPTVR